MIRRKKVGKGWSQDPPDPPSCPPKATTRENPPRFTHQPRPTALPPGFKPISAGARAGRGRGCAGASDTTITTTLTDKYTPPARRLRSRPPPTSVPAPAPPTTSRCPRQRKLGGPTGDDFQHHRRLSHAIQIPSAQHVVLFDLNGVLAVRADRIDDRQTTTSTHRRVPISRQRTYTSRPGVAHLARLALRDDITIGIYTSATRPTAMHALTEIHRLMAEELAPDGAHQGASWREAALEAVQRAQVTMRTHGRRHPYNGPRPSAPTPSTGAAATRSLTSPLPPIVDPNEIQVDDDALSDEDVRVRMESEGTMDTKTRAHGQSTNNQDMNNKNNHRSRGKIRSPLDHQVDVPLAGANDASLKAALTQLSATILDGGSKDGSAVPHHTSRAHHPLPPLGDPHGVGLFRVVLTRDSCRPAREWVHAGVVVDKPWATVKPIAVHVAHTEGVEIRVDVVEEEEEEVETGVKKKTTTKQGTEVLHRVILVDDSEMKVLPTERQQLLLLPELTAQDMDDARDVRAGERDGDERLPSDTVLEVIVDAFCQELEKTAEVTVTQNARTTTKGRSRGHGRSPKKKSTTTGAPRLVDVLPDVQREVWERERVRLEAMAARKLVCPSLPTTSPPPSSSTVSSPSSQHRLLECHRVCNQT